MLHCRVRVHLVLEGDKAIIVSVVPEVHADVEDRSENLEPSSEIVFESSFLDPANIYHPTLLHLSLGVLLPLPPLLLSPLPLPIVGQPHLPTPSHTLAPAASLASPPASTCVCSSPAAATAGDTSAATPPLSRLLPATASTTVCPSHNHPPPPSSS